MLLPRDAIDLKQIVADAAASGRKLEVCGGGTRVGFGAPREVECVSLRSIAGVVDYDPAELVLTLRPGTPLADVVGLVASEGQMLAFEPWGEPGATIGGTVAAGVAGSRRVTAGATRDHLLGFAAVSGRGEVFVAGGKVVKNVTGYDLPKLMAGSWGRIGAMTELTLKVLPAPRVAVTMVVEGLSPVDAHQAMARALGSNADISAAAHLARGITLLRVAGFAPSVEERCRALPTILSDLCTANRLDEAEAAPFWHEAMTGARLSGSVRWQVHLPPRQAPALVEQLLPFDIDWAMDWGGGRVWVALSDQGDGVRAVAALLGGEATLIHAPEAMRARLPAMPPRAPAVLALEQRVRRAFDPTNVFASGRFHEDL